MQGKDNGKGTSAPNPAQNVQTPQIPAKSIRDGGERDILSTPKGIKK